MLVSVSDLRLENNAATGSQHTTQRQNTAVSEFYKICAYPKFCGSMLEWAQSRDITRFAVWLNIHDQVTSLYGFNDLDTEYASLLWQHVHNEHISKLKPTSEPLLEEALRHLRCEVSTKEMCALQATCKDADLTLQQFLSLLRSQLSVNATLEPELELQLALSGHDFRTARRLLYQQPKLARKISWSLLMETDTALLLNLYKVCVEIHRAPAISQLRRLAFRFQQFDILETLRVEDAACCSLQETAVLRAERWFQTLRLWDACLQKDAVSAESACQHGAYAQAERALAYRLALQLGAAEVLQVLKTFLTEYERATAEHIDEDAVHEFEKQVFQAIT